MRAAQIIYRREMGQYLSSPVHYLMAFGFLLLTGLVFNNNLAFSVTRKPVDPDAIPTFLTLLMVVFAPLLTMRLIAEENREGRLELLLTAPIHEYSIILGKFFAAWTYFTLLLGCTLIYQIILITISIPDLSHTFVAYMGIWLYGGACLSFGILFSALTENQILAAFLATAALFIMYLGDSIGQIISSVNLALIIRNLTLQGHFSSSFAIGVIRFEDIVFYIGMITVGLYISIQILSSWRWR